MTSSRSGQQVVLDRVDHLGGELGAVVDDLNDHVFGERLANAHEPLFELFGDRPGRSRP